MAGSNQPPKEGSREQLERDNEINVFADKPFSEEGGAVGEADPMILTLDDALEEAMRDADPEAHKAGLREDATISSSRIFAAGSLIAALGRDNLTPETHTEPTNQAADYTPYGHDEDLVNRIGNEHMAGTAEGKIAGTIGARKEEELYLKEKEREEERIAAYIASSAVSAAEATWDALWDDYDADYQSLIQENIDFNASIESSQITIDNYLNTDLPQHRARVDAVDAALNDGTTDALHAQAESAPAGSHEALEAAAAVEVREDAAGVVNGQPTHEASLGTTLREAMNATEQAATSNRELNTQLQSYVNHLVTDTQSWHDRIPDMSGAEAKQALLDSYRLQAQHIGGMSGEEARATLVGMANDQIRKAELAGNSESAQQWTSWRNDLASVSGDSAKQHLLRGVNERIQNVSEMSDDQAKSELLAQAQLQLDYSRSVQSQAETITRQIQQATQLSSELEEMRTQYAEKAELLSRDGLTQDEAAELRALEMQIFEKNNDLAELNGKVRHNEQLVYNSLKAQTANFNLGADHHAAERERLEQTITDARTASIVADIQNARASDRVSQNADVAGHATGLEGPQANAGLVTPESVSLLAGSPPRPGTLDMAGPHSGDRVMSVDTGNLTEKVTAFQTDLAQMQSEGTQIGRDQIVDLAKKHGLDEVCLRTLLNSSAPSIEGGVPAAPEVRTPVEVAPPPVGVDTATAGPLLMSPVVDPLMSPVSKPVGIGVLSLEELDRQFGTTQSTPLFGYSAYSLTTVPVTTIPELGYTGSPLMSDCYGVSGGQYSSFCESPEFTDYNPTAEETGGVTPSYEQPWYTSAWNATTDFMSSIFGGSDKQPSPTDPLGQQPGVMLASNDPNISKAAPLAGQSGGGGTMA